MLITVHVPTSLREFAAGQPRVILDLSDSATVQEVFGRLHETHPGIAERVLNEHGEVRQHVNVFVNGNSIRLGHGLATRVEAGAEIWILPAVSGG
jgi:molybdopterin synthase sulfur carrier subunit